MLQVDVAIDEVHLTSTNYSSLGLTVRRYEFSFLFLFFTLLDLSSYFQDSLHPQYSTDIYTRLYPQYLRLLYRYRLAVMPIITIRTSIIPIVIRIGPYAIQ